MIIQGVNYCTKNGHEIDYELVRKIRPKCIEEMNGCGNCPKISYSLSISKKEEKP
jgi:hypothetical protein